MKQNGLLLYLTRRLGDPSGHGPEYSFHCPFCSDRLGTESTGKKLGVNVDKGQANCFRCHYAANTTERLLRDLNGGRLLKEELDLAAREVATPEDGLLKTLLVRFYARNTDRPLKPVRPPYETLWMEKDFRPLMYKPWHYLLIDRHVSNAEELVPRYHLGYCPTGKYGNRIIFPVRQGGRVVYFTNRYCGDHPRKSMNPENRQGYFTREMCLLGYDQCVGKKVVPVVEGPLSMLAFDHAVATMGKVISEPQIQLLETLAEQGTEEFVIALDPDASREAVAVNAALRDRLPKVTYLPLPPGQDPHDCRNVIDVIMAQRREMRVSDRMRAIKVNLKRRLLTKERPGRIISR